jgi:hypothetical protein
MSALRNVEDTIGGFVERVFGRLFRGHVEPVELARKLAREMEDHKTVSVTRVYVPNEYIVYLSSSDRARFASFEGSLTNELGLYVAERARHEGFTLLSAPVVRLETDTDLRVGEYGIACRVVDLPAEPIGEVDASAPDVAPSPFAPPAPANASPAAAAATASAGADAAGDGIPKEPPAVGAVAPAAGVAAGAALGLVAGRGDGDDHDGDVASDDAATPGDAVPDADAGEPAAVGPVDEAAAEPAPAPAAEAPPEPAAPPPPLPPPGGYEPLAGVSGTQILSPAEARAEGLVQEELFLLVEGRRHRVTQRSTTIGRSRECDIVLQDANASRQHAEIRHIGLDYFAVDLGSTNGTLVNGQRIRRQALANGDRIMIGTTEIVVEHVA